jgi:RNA polymerase sigma-70 factor (ECF subfamily)
VSAEPQAGDFPESLLKASAGGEKAASVIALESTRLMLAAKAGDGQAFDDLVLRLRGRAFKIAQGLVGSREDAMDLAQEAFLKVFRARETFREGELFLPWFHRILRNTCYTHLRKKGRIARRSLNPGFGDDSREGSGEWELVDDDAAAPADRMVADERAQAFWQAFRKLAARDKEILSLRHFRENSYQEIAGSLGIPIGTVMSRLFHARRRLRDELAGNLNNEFAELGAERDAREAKS